MFAVEHIHKKESEVGDPEMARMRFIRDEEAS